MQWIKEMLNISPKSGELDVRVWSSLKNKNRNTNGPS